MKRQKILFFTGLLLIIVPLLGFPLWFRNLFMILAGIFVCILSYLERGAAPFFKRHKGETFDVPLTRNAAPQGDDASQHVLHIQNENKIS